MNIVERIKLTAKLSGAKLVITANPLQWSFVPSIKTKSPYADELFVVGDYFKMIEITFLCVGICAWIDTGSEDDLLAETI